VSQTSPIDYFSLRHPLRRAASLVSYSARKKMFAHFVRAIDPSPKDRVVDVGVTPDRSLPESNFFEHLYPYKAQLTATSIEDATFLESTFPGLTFVQTVGTTLPFADNEFDIVVCFAVLEHVGNRDAQRAFVRELLRIGRKLYLTTPNRGFPVELHTFLPFLHWLPQALHQRVLRRLGFAFWAETANLNLLSRKELERFFPAEANVSITGHKLLGLTSNLIAIRP